MAGATGVLPSGRMPSIPSVAAWTLAILNAASIAAAGGAPDVRDPLARARTLYNQRQYDAAISAAEQARTTPGLADSADLVAARAYLERYRESAAADDLSNARDRLRQIDPRRFATPERAEFIVGLGEALYFDEAYGAAAEIFDSVLTGPDAVALGDARERALDWWATALDRDAKPRPELDRQGIYHRIRERMADELALHPASGAAAYWAAAGAWALGDLQTAWGAAQAGWARAPLGVDHGAALRADLDRLMLRGIIPDRARLLGVAADGLRLDWEHFKEQWVR